MIASFLIPAAAFSLLPKVMEPSGFVPLHNAVFAVSVAHGGLSGLFWIDRRYRRHLTENRTHSYGVPLAILACALIGVAIGGRTATLVIAAIYLGWTVIHFSRQNWGVLCLSASGLGAPRPSTLELHGCNIAGVGAAIALATAVLAEQRIPVAQWIWISSIGLLAAIVAFALAAIAAVRQLRAKVQFRQIALTLLVGTYFVPIFILDPFLGLTWVGVTHAIQYARIMWHVAADQSQGNTILRVAGMFASAGIYLIAFYVLRDGARWGLWADVALVTLYSVVIWHFLLDARMFRLRDHAPRLILQQSLPFLFRPRRAA